MAGLLPINYIIGTSTYYVILLQSSCYLLDQDE